MREITNSALFNFAVWIPLSFPYLLVSLTAHVTIILTSFISVHIIVFHNSLLLLLIIYFYPISLSPNPWSPIIFHPSFEGSSFRKDSAISLRGICVLLQHIIISVLMYLPNTTKFSLLHPIDILRSGRTFIFLFFLRILEHLTSHYCLINFLEEKNH